MSNGSEHRFEFNAVRITGLLLIVLGMAFIVFFGINMNQKSSNIPEQETADESDDIADEALRDEERLRENNIKNTASSSIPMLIIGALMTFAGVPMFYKPYVDKGIKLRRQRKKRKEEIPDKDPEFDYPDDESNFILRRETYELLHKEQLENIRKKYQQRQ